MIGCLHISQTPSQQHWLFSSAELIEHVRAARLPSACFHHTVHTHTHTRAWVRMHGCVCVWASVPITHTELRPREAAYTHTHSP